MTESNELESETLEMPEITNEDRVRYALEDHIETLQRELMHSKQREHEARTAYEQIVERVGRKRKWW